MENKKLTLEQAVEHGKKLIADWQWAYVCQDRVLMDKYCHERARFEGMLGREYGEDFACDYYNALYAA